MMQIAEYLELKKGYAVIQCVYGDSDKDNNYSELDEKNFYRLHLKKIDISDAIYVVNVNGYMSKPTKREIEYAKLLQKEIFSLVPLD